MRGWHGALTAASGARAAGGEAVREKIELDRVPGMNCSEFEKVVIEIARNGMGDAAALAHAQACTRCGRRLANEQTLTGAMASLALEDAARGASAETEGALLAEFRQRHQAARPRFRLAYAMGAIAAVLLLAIAVSLRRGE